MAGSTGGVCHAFSEVAWIQGDSKGEMVRPIPARADTVISRQNGFKRRQKFYPHLLLANVPFRSIV